MSRKPMEEGIVEELIDEVLPEQLDWRRMVRTYPVPALLIAAAGGYLLGRHKGLAVLASLSGFAASEVAERFAGGEA